MEIRFVRRRVTRLSLVAVCAALMVVPLAGASPNVVLEKMDTYDADMINSIDTGCTGEGVYVAVLDSGMAPNWKDYFPTDRVLTTLAKGFKEEILWDPVELKFIESGSVHEIGWIGSLGTTHGTHVTSTIIGYNYYAPADAATGLVLPPIYVNGIAPDVKIIPVRVLADYHIGMAHTDEVDYPDKTFVMGTDRAVAAGIDYATDLAIAGYSPMIITMSLGGPLPAQVIEDSIDRAIDNGVIVVASAGNEGDAGMGWPGAYPQVISVGACGWKYEWYYPDGTEPSVSDDGVIDRFRLWWLQDDSEDSYGYIDVAEGSSVIDELYIASWSSREKPELDQELDVIAPGAWVRGPYPGVPGYAHLPWWSYGAGEMSGMNPGNFYYVGGTSMSAPHVTAVVAQMLQKDLEAHGVQTLDQDKVEQILKETALEIPAGEMLIFDLPPNLGWNLYSWDDDATGSGLIQADLALAEV